MPSQDETATEPIRVTDKREERRLEAAARAAAEQDRLEAERRDGPPDPEALHQARLERIAALRQEGADDDYLSDAQQQELLRLQAEEEAWRQANPVPETVSLRTAFLVTVDHDGRVMATSDVNILMEIDHEATIDEMDAGCALVRRDIAAAITSQQTVFGLQVSAQAMAEKQQAVAVAQQLAARGAAPGRKMGR